MGTPGMMQITVRELREGDLVDLETCPFLAHNTIAEFEYGEVGSIEQETPGCWLVSYDNVSLAAGYSPDQVLSVVRRADAQRTRRNLHRLTDGTS